MSNPSQDRHEKMRKAAPPIEIDEKWLANQFDKQFKTEEKAKCQN